MAVLPLTPLQPGLLRITPDSGPWIDPRSRNAAGDGSTDDTAALTATIAAVPTSGGTVVIPPGCTFVYSSVLALPAHIRIVGFGRSSVLRGPGLSQRFAVNGSNDADLHIEDVLLDGTSYTASGRGIDSLAGSMVTLERVKFIGFRDQVVVDQGQRLSMRSCEHVASSATRFGLWIPKGPEANVGVDAAVATTNIVYVANSHFNWFNSSSGTPIAADGGLQHTYDNVQCSYGVNSARIAGVSGVTFRGCDFEFMTGDTLVTATTAAGDGSTVGSVAALTVGPGNYFGGQVDLTGCDMLLDIGNEFHVPSLPVYRNVPSALHGASLASGNVSSGGTMFETNPSTNFSQIDRTGLALLPKTLLAQDYRSNSSTATNPQLWVSTLPSSSASYGVNRGFGVDNAGKAVINSDGLRTQKAGSDSNILDDGSGRTVLAGTLKTAASSTSTRPSASAEGLGAQMFDSTLKKPIWSDGTNWRDAAGSVV